MRSSMTLLAAMAACVGAAADTGCPPDAEAARQALNALRLQPQSCGAQVLPPAQPLRWQPVLAESARRFAVELSGRDKLDHIGDAGTTLRMRLNAAGYRLRIAGENLGGGPELLDEMLAMWLHSPGHCENLMLAEAQEFGLACVAGPGRLQRYWVLHLAAPAARPKAP